MWNARDTSTLHHTPTDSLPLAPLGPSELHQWYGDLGISGLQAQKMGLWNMVQSPQRVGREEAQRSPEGGLERAELRARLFPAYV